MQMDQEKDVLERLREVHETVAPRHMSKLTLEDDIGMIHELTQVSRHLFTQSLAHLLTVDKWSAPFDL